MQHVESEEHTKELRDNKYQHRIVKLCHKLQKKIGKRRKEKDEKEQEDKEDKEEKEEKEDRKDSLSM